MLSWYLGLTIGQRALLWLLAAAFVAVMAATFRGMLFRPWSWYRGVQSTPLFQFLMWLGALPLLIPALIFVQRRRRKLSTARFIGNIRSRIYHLPQCEYQKKITSFFFRYPLKSIKEAQERGFRACHVCYPDNFSD